MSEHPPTPIPPRRVRRFLKRFRKNQEGGAAVEFALVALPFFGMMVAVIELGIFFMASRYFEDGIFNASRKVMTQSLSQTGICTAFKNEIAANFPSWLNPTLVNLSVSNSNLGSFSGGTAVDLNNGMCTFGAPGQVVRVTATYPYPFRGFRIALGGQLWGANIDLTMSTVFRVEPP